MVQRIGSNRLAGIVAGLFVSVCAAAAAAAPPSSLELQQLQAHVDGLYDRSAVRHSFTQPSGAVIDCVELAAQPGLRNAKDHRIATPPPTGLQLHQQMAPGLHELSGTEVLLERGVRNGAGVEMYCPEGTVPVRQITAADLARVRSVEELQRKHPGDPAEGLRGQQGHLFSGSQIQVPGFGPNSLHQYAHAAWYGLANHGANVTINVWSPYVQSNSEFSLGQLWVVNGSGSGLQTLEGGVQKYQGLYGDSNPHLFIYSTSNGYGNQGCYNLQCGRFVQVNNSVAIGGGISPISADGATQYEVQMAYYLWQGNWWFQFQGTWVGYYPGSLFNAAGLASGSSVIDFGGEIIDDRSQHSYHTFTQMGSGQSPSAWYQHAGYMRNIYYWDPSGNAYWATGLSPYRDDAYCYDIAKYDNDPNWHTYFFYGGPGYNVNCQ
jgi:hypothetical protein